MNQIRAIRDHLLAELLPGVIHEINNPLGAVIMNISIAKEDITAWRDEGTLPDVGMMQETCHDLDIAAERMNQHLLALSFFAGARFLEERGSYDVNQALRHALTLYHNKLKRHLKVTVETEEDGFLYLGCGPARGILAMLLALDTVLGGGGGKELSIRVGAAADRVRVAFTREDMKFGDPDERLVALARVDDIQLTMRDAELVLELAAHDPDSATG